MYAVSVQFLGRSIETWFDVRIDREVPLADAGEAHRALAERRTTGKVLLVP